MSGLELFLSDVVERLGAGFQLLDRELRYVYLNEAVETHARRSRAELLGQRMQDAYPGIDHTEVFATLMHCLDTGEVAHLENEFVYPDGVSRWFMLSIQPVTEGVIIMSLDVTDHKLVAQQLVRAQRMAAVGRLASGVAHDFNNLLTVIESSAAFALESQTPNNPAVEELNQIRRTVERATALTRKLLAFAGQRAERPRCVDPNSLLNDLQRMLRRVLGDDVIVTMDLATHLWTVFMDPASFEQIVMNLVINARDAMPEGGELTIGTKNLPIEEELRMRWGRPIPKGDYVQIAVTDSGMGMTPEVQEHIFEPFFTTKEPGTGTGLGLSTCFGLVEQAGGYIAVYSEAGQGSTFRIYLPRARRRLTDTQNVPLRPPPPRGQERVAVVEDDEDVRAGIIRVLHGLGYEVVVIEQPTEAIHRLSEEPVDLLIADVMMPGVIGPDLVAQIRRKRPELRVLYVSGFPGSVALQRRIVESTDPLLEKPFSPDTLAHEVRRALE